MHDKEEFNKKQNNEMCLRTGEVTCDDSLTSLFYSILRDGLISPSDLESLVREIEYFAARGEVEFKYTNGWIAKYSEDLSHRLRDINLKNMKTNNRGFKNE